MGQFLPWKSRTAKKRHASKSKLMLPLKLAIWGMGLLTSGFMIGRVLTKLCEYRKNKFSAQQAEERNISDTEDTKQSPSAQDAKALLDCNRIEPSPTYKKFIDAKINQCQEAGRKGKCQKELKKLAKQLTEQEIILDGKADTIQKVDAFLREPLQEIMNNKADNPVAIAGFIDDFIQAHSLDILLPALARRYASKRGTKLDFGMVKDFTRSQLRKLSGIKKRSPEQEKLIDYLAAHITASPKIVNCLRTHESHDSCFSWLHSRTQKEKRTELAIMTKQLQQHDPHHALATIIELPKTQELSSLIDNIQKDIHKPVMMLMRKHKEYKNLQKEYANNQHERESYTKEIDEEIANIQAQLKKKQIELEQQITFIQASPEEREDMLLEPNTEALEKLKEQCEEPGFQAKEKIKEINAAIEAASETASRQITPLQKHKEFINASPEKQQENLDKIENMIIKKKEKSYNMRFNQRQSILDLFLPPPSSRNGIQPKTRKKIIKAVKLLTVHNPDDKRYRNLICGGMLLLASSFTKPISGIDHKDINGIDIMFQEDAKFYNNSAAKEPVEFTHKNLIKLGRAFYNKGKKPKSASR